MNWTRVTKNKPCKLCGKGDYCTRSDTFHACMRVHDAPGRFKGAKNGASLYWVDGIVREYRPSPELPPPPKEEYADMGSLARQYAVTANGSIAALAAQIGVSMSALVRLGAGWDGEADTFPMFDADRRCIGIRRRFADGKKLSISGGHEGVFLPDGFPERDDVLICEGPTDTAAALSLGFEALGRPSCRGAVDITARLCAGVKCIIVADADKPGQDGAKALVEKLKCARMLTPPAKAKDLRGWVAAGLNGDALRMLIKSTR